MAEVYVTLPTPERVQQFVRALTPLNGDFELISGKHILDARSLMGVFSLDLSGPILLKIYNDCPENLGAVSPFLSAAEVPKHE